ncbi:MAG: hypothetical protein H0T71_14905 [Acidobacteria bacterium]|nr:hypothetical protein [Acidobacteriota bacterium]
MKSTAWGAVVAGMIGVAPALAAVAEPAGMQGTKASATKPAETVETVAVGGCLKEGRIETWDLLDASEPVASSANAPSPKELADLPKSGTSKFELMGVAIFNLPSHRNHAVVVKGLLIKASPVNRINVTSVTTISDTCLPKP